MKEIKEVKKTSQEMISYEAIDGTKFSSAQECLAYEETVVCTLNLRYQGLVLATTDEEALFEGNPEHSIDIIKLENSGDINTVINKIIITNGYSKEHFPTEYIQILQEALKTKNYVFVVSNCDCDYMWIIGSKEDIIKRIDNVLKCIK